MPVGLFSLRTHLLLGVELGVVLHQASGAAVDAQEVHRLVALQRRGRRTSVCR